MENPDAAMTRTPDDAQPFSGLAFKIMADPFVGTLTFVRIYRRAALPILQICTQSLIVPGSMFRCMCSDCVRSKPALLQEAVQEANKVSTCISLERHYMECLDGMLLHRMSESSGGGGSVRACPAVYCSVIPQD